MSKILLPLLLIISIHPATLLFAQEEEGEILLESHPNDHDFYKFYIYDSVEYSQSTPYHALHTHLDFLDEQNYHPKTAARVIPTSVGNLDTRIELAEELKLIFAGKGIYLNQLDLPLQKDHVEKNTGKKRFIINEKLPEIYLIKVGERWRYSSYSALKINKIFKETFPPYSRDIIKFVSKIEKGNNYVLGLKVWQWGALLGISILMYIVYFVVIRLLAFFIKQFFSKEGNQYFISTLILKYKRPVTIAVLVFLFYILIPLLLLDSTIAFGLTVLCKVVFGFTVVVFIFRTADLLVLQVMTTGTKKKRWNIDAHLTPVLRSSLRIVALMIGFLFFLKILGYNINNIVTGISFGGLIIAFAAQDTVKNFIGSIMLFTDKPFSVGDSIVVKGQSGIVEEIGFRTTKIRTFNNSLVSLPNNIAADNEVDNMGKREFRRFNTLLSLEYGTDRKNLKLFIEEVRKAIDNHPTTRKEGYQVRLYQFAPSSIDILLNVFFETDDYNIELQSREELMFTIMEIADTSNVQFAFPTQTIHLNEKKE
ncbi:mechanosensitive ion channel family protein [Flammeovirga aprica]|uniref:Mechanosensitive ion channel n=1 Tax=Flammeovirga aprica JL-4 TaxID=694437 RepID=A0A7X9P196_9BACT|nr:mechanosensitive ion channel family protein [Flammeovirga aprica]NME67162.1 mechanosensitive ion channel [Flammeovirga aprica JL-4]